jgi:hypothetical protein
MRWASAIAGLVISAFVVLVGLNASEGRASSSAMDCHQATAATVETAASAIHEPATSPIAFQESLDAYDSDRGAMPMSCQHDVECSLCGLCGGMVDDLPLMAMEHAASPEPRLQPAFEGQSIAADTGPPKKSLL